MLPRAQPLQFFCHPLGMTKSALLGHDDHEGAGPNEGIAFRPCRRWCPPQFQEVQVPPGARHWRSADKEKEVLHGTPMVAMQGQMARPLRIANKGGRNDRLHTCWGKPRVPAPDIACPKLVFLQGPLHLLGDVDTMTRFVRSNKAHRESIVHACAEVGILEYFLLASPQITL